MSNNTDDKDVLAAEYVLGTLDAQDRANVHMLAAVDPGFAEIVARWERRLGELHVMVDPVEPPKGAWEAIRAKIVGVTPTGEVWLPTQKEVAASVAAAAAARAEPADATTPELHREKASVLIIPPSMSAAIPQADRGELVELAGRVRHWRTATVGMTALAASLVAFVAARDVRPDMLPAPLRPTPIVVEKPVEVVRTVEVPSARMAEFVAVFQKDDASPSFLLTVDVEKRTLSVRKVGAPQEANKSYELWILPVGATAPRSLGLVEGNEFTVRRNLSYDQPTLTRATFGISLEPAGGSPTGAPTGPVLHGKLLQTTPSGFPQATP
jgi:anti-sigma-K factor RskA